MIPQLLPALLGSDEDFALFSDSTPATTVPFEEALETYLLDQASITAIVRSRIYPLRLPQKSVFPCLSYRRITGGWGHDLRGSDGSAAPLFQIDCWSNTKSVTRALALAVRESLQGYSGLMSDITVFAVILQGEIDLYESPKDASTAAIYHTALTFEILYKVSVPRPSEPTGIVTDEQLDPGIVVTCPHQRHQ